MLLAPARGTRDVALRLVDLLGREPAGAPPLMPLAQRAPPRRVVAVDGSNTTLAEGGEHLLGAYRCGRVLLQDGAPVATEPMDAQVVLVTPQEGKTFLRQALDDAGLPGHAVTVPSNEACLKALRSLAELRCAEESLALLDQGDLLLLDGPLQSYPAAPLLDRILLAARAQGIDVVGVCKSTSLTVGPVPALVACQLAGRRHPATTWWARLDAPPTVRGVVCAARLSHGEERVFRFDVQAADGEVPRVLGSLAALAGHPAYPGYPSPLAMAHNAALLNEETRRRLLADLREEATRAGVPEEAWMGAFFDYHEILELGA